MSELNQTLDKLSKELSKTRSSLNRDATIILVVSVLLFSVFLAYFIYGYNQFKEVTEPDQLMDTAETLVADNLKSLRRNMQAEVEQNADKWAEQLSEEAVKTVPKMRVQLEKFVTDQISERVEQSIEITEPEFDKLVKENKEPLQKAFKDLAENPDASGDLVDLLTTGIDARLKSDVQADADNVLNLMRQLKAKVRKLAKGENLTDEEKLEREILMTARLIQQKKVN